MIGLYIQHDAVRAVDIIRKSRGFVLNAVAEQPVELPAPGQLRPLSVDETAEYQRNFSESLVRILSEKGFSSGGDVALAIDIRNAFIHTVPFDGNFASDNLKRIIEWELSRFFPDISPDAYLFDTYNPGFNPSRDASPRFIYTAVLRSFIQILQEGVRSARLNLSSINVDLFTIENLLRLLDGSAKKEKLSAVCYRYDDILHCCLLWNHRLVRYREYTIDSGNRPEAWITTFLSTAGSVQSNVEQRIFYVPAEDDLAAAELESAGWGIESFRPFDILHVRRRIQKFVPVSPRLREPFAPAVSVALRD
jgi:Tfp pilus assembly PilM family ATPase